MEKKTRTREERITRRRNKTATKVTLTMMTVITRAGKKNKDGTFI